MERHERRAHFELILSKVPHSVEGIEQFEKIVKNELERAKRETPERTKYIHYLSMDIKREIDAVMLARTKPSKRKRLFEIAKSNFLIDVQLYS
jgi:hypothetical protein